MKQLRLSNSIFPSDFFATKLMWYFMVPQPIVKMSWMAWATCVIKSANLLKMSLIQSPEWINGFLSHIFLLWFCTRNGSILIANICTYHYSIQPGIIHFQNEPFIRLFSTNFIWTWVAGTYFTLNTYQELFYGIYTIWMFQCSSLSGSKSHH